ncbi:MAG: N-acetylmuramic acid 6-phosphate etherase [Kangiellaceae bacterium]|nr:N-acetylmuramic acid 6-phosphate etherase [Kangiellaceae bacterium]
MSNSELIETLTQLISESQNQDTLDLDTLSSLDIATKLNQQDFLVPKAVSVILPEIAKAIDSVVEVLSVGGRLVYLGAGTSGRLGILDAVECVPTFSVPEGLVVGLLAGGNSAMFKAKEGIEDKQSEGVKDLQSIDFNSSDILVGIAASGRTPYVIGGLKYAQELGAKTIAISSNPNAVIADMVDISLLPVVGPEPIAGSTRMKSGTVQKLILNMISTASMVRLGKVYKNLMVDVKASNEKLYARGIRLVMELTSVDQDTAEKTLKLADMKVKLAVMMLLADVDAIDGENLLSKSDGFLRKALQTKNS